tara:strand:+ start:99 stop:284 length:186 start_codon:yes stop_codon:yes gene_type:complete
MLTGVMLNNLLKPIMEIGYLQFQKSQTKILLLKKKWDLTPFGHHSGTGIVDFGDNITITGL